MTQYTESDLTYRIVRAVPSLYPLWRAWRMHIIARGLQEIHPSRRDVPAMVRELNAHRTGTYLRLRG